MNIHELEEHIKGLLTPPRFEHSVSVRGEAIRLAKHYGADVDKAALAGLLHDAAKDFSFDEAMALSKEFGIELDFVSSYDKKLLHAPVGAAYVNQKLGIDDEEILDAIAYHTTGKPNMGLLTKIIYVADYIEPTRKHFDGLTELRDLAYRNLDLAVKFGLELTIQKLLYRNKLIHDNTLNARNYYIIMGL